LKTDYDQGRQVEEHSGLKLQRSKHHTGNSTGTSGSGCPFEDFLENIILANGYNVMKNISVKNRIKWMKFCSVLWNNRNRKFNCIYFKPDGDFFGEDLNSGISAIDNIWLRDILEYNTFNDPETTYSVNKYLKKVGIRFSIEKKVGIFIPV
jgi:hypothetical protein